MPLEPVGSMRELESANQDAALYVLAVGVGAFQQASLAPLRFAEKDARDVVDTFESIGRRYWKSVETELLVGQKATRVNVLRAIETLSRRVQPQDTVIFFFAGHGLCDERSDVYYFAPYDLADDSPLATAVHGSLLCEHLLPLSGRRIVIVDTCNSGNITDWCAPHRSDIVPGDKSIVLRQFSRAQSASRAASADGESEALVIMASTRAGQEALESARWDNGVFTKALLEGIGGRADNGTGAITLRMLSSYLRSRVRELTKATQEPVCTVLAGAQDFELIRSSPTSAEPIDADPMLGKSFSGFEVVARIAQTACSTIYRAVEEGNDAAFIQLRALTISDSAQPALVEQFREAAEALQQVSHPALVRILEPGGMSSDGRAFIVFEGSPGRLLGEVIHGALDQSLVLQLLLGVLDGLMAMHKQGVLYLSLSPNRIVLREPPAGVLLLDGDHSCVRGRRRPIVLRDESAMITDRTDPELFLAPELESADNPGDEHADVFALGALAYLLYANTPPFAGSTYGDLRAAKRQRFAKIETLVPKLAPAVAELLNRMVNPDPTQRPRLAEVREIWQGRQPNNKLPPPFIRPQPAVPVPTDFSSAEGEAASNNNAGTVWLPPAARPSTEFSSYRIGSPESPTLIDTDFQAPRPPSHLPPLTNQATQILFRPELLPPRPKPGLPSYLVAMLVVVSVLCTGLLSLLASRWLWQLQEAQTQHTERLPLRLAGRK